MPSEPHGSVIGNKLGMAWVVMVAVGVTGKEPKRGSGRVTAEWLQASPSRDVEREVTKQGPRRHSLSVPTHLGSSRS